MFDFAMQGRPLSARVLEILGCVARRRHDAAMPVADGKQQRDPGRKNLSWANRAGTLIVLLGIVALYSNSAQATIPTNPIPYVSIISPLTVLPGGSAFTLTVTGANFISNSVVYWGSTALVTTYVSRGKLQAAVPANLIAAEGTGWITVFNPTPVGGRSGVAFLQVGHPVAAYNPTIISVLPTGNSYFISHAQGDFNGDGKMDLVALDEDLPVIWVFLGNGDGTFQAGVSYPIPISDPFGVAVGDVNGDGKLDIIVSSVGSGMDELLGNGDGTFQAATAFGSMNVSEQYAFLADVNGDGFLDILVADNGSNTINYYQGNGDGTFQNSVTIGTLDSTSGIIAVGDFNGDGILDIAAGNEGDTTIALFLGNGDGSFQTAQVLTGQGKSWVAAVGDFNEDGWLDFVGGDFGGTGSPGTNSSLLLNNAGSGFLPSTLLNIGSGRIYAIGVADLNGDGHADIIGNELTGGAMTVSLGAGNGTFAAFVPVGVNFFWQDEPITVGNFVSGGGVGFVGTDESFGAVDVILLSVTVSPTPLPFGNVAINSTAAAMALTITNNSTTGVTLVSSVISGTNSSEFVISGTTCGTTLASGASCSSSIAFTPLATGARSATFTLTDTGAGLTQTAALTGTGVTASAVLLTPSSSVTFANQALTTTSAPQIVTVKNSGNATLNIASILLGGANAADFGKTSTCGTTLAVSASCTITVTFTPSASGMRNATVTLTDDALDSPQTLLLSGTGVTSNPQPVLAMLSPTTATAGGAGFTLTLTGTNFVAGTIVEWNGVALATTVVSGTQLTAVVPAIDIAAGGTAALTVLNPAPGGGASAAITFTINDPLPTLGLLSPTTANAGGAAFTLTLTGTNFLAGTIVKWNGVALATTVVSGTQLTVVVPAIDIAAGGTAAVTVLNPAPGGGTSAPITFTINDPLPTLGLLSPTTATAGGAAFTLTLTGTNFVAGTVVDWNGVALTTTFVSATEVTALVPAGDLATGGAILVTVFNPLPGGGTSAALTLTIADFAVSSSTPTQTVAAGQPAAFSISTATVGGAFPNPVTFTVTGLPRGAAATFNPASVTPGTSTMMTVTTTARPVSAFSRNPFDQQGPLFPASFPAAANLSMLLATLLAGFGFARLRHKLPRGVAPVAALIITLVVTVAFIAGCGSTSRPASTGTPAGTYVLTVTGTSGTDAHSAAVTMVVQ
jgi:hypothetical protein